MSHTKPTHLAAILMSAASLVACSTAATPVEGVASDQILPADVFDLSQWNITVPLDTDGNERADIVSVADLQTYMHPDFFYLDDNGGLVFATPNKATTTPNSTNTRSELRQMLRGTERSIRTAAPGNSFALAAHPFAERFASIGGRLDATLHVDHVAERAEVTNKKPTYSVVVGQIHAVKVDGEQEGFGWGNEPLKISYKKFPDHEYGSVYWTYERNLARENPDRTDIAYPVFGNTWDNNDDPGDAGIKLGEDFSYTVDVTGNVMTLTFDTERHDTVTYQIHLANNVDAYGEIDEKDNPIGYAGDWFYFKAGAYNQCSSQMREGFWYPGCLGTGDWETDKANGDYAQVTFHQLTLGEPTPQ